MHCGLHTTKQMCDIDGSESQTWGTVRNYCGLDMMPSTTHVMHGHRQAWVHLKLLYIEMPNGIVFSFLMH